MQGMGCSELGKTQFLLNTLYIMILDYVINQGMGKQEEQLEERSGSTK